MKEHLTNVSSPLNPFMPNLRKRDMGKQCRSRSDATEHSVWSGSTQFALNTLIYLNHGNNKI